MAVLAAALSYEPLSEGENMLAASDVARFYSGLKRKSMSRKSDEELENVTK